MSGNGKRFDCKWCQFAHECGSQVWECDHCESIRDLRPQEVQFSLVRSDDTPNTQAVEREEAPCSLL